METQNTKFSIASTSTTNDLVKNLISEVKQEKGFKHDKEAFEYIIKDYINIKESAKIKAESKVKELKEIGGNSTKKGTGLDRVSLFVEALIKHNEKCNESDYIYITPTFVEREGKLFRKNVTAYFTENSKLLEKHHSKFGITERVNLRFRNKELFPRENNTLIFVTDILKSQNLWEIFA